MFVSTLKTGNILPILPTTPLHTVLKWVKFLSSLVDPYKMKKLNESRPLSNDQRFQVNTWCICTFWSISKPMHLYVRCSL